MLEFLEQFLKKLNKKAESSDKLLPTTAEQESISLDPKIEICKEYLRNKRIEDIFQVMPIRNKWYVVKPYYLGTVPSTVSRDEFIAHFPGLAKEKVERKHFNRNEFKLNYFILRCSIDVIIENISQNKKLEHNTPHNEKNAPF